MRVVTTLHECPGANYSGKRQGNEIRFESRKATFGRIEERRADWKHWGPYVSERAWGTVREDYSPDGLAWNYFPHDHARSRAYRWNEDGLGGFCNRYQNLCLAVAVWNEEDPILKERLFGLSGEEGNHGEDVKEYYFYLDGTPTHSYMKMLYKYPQAAFPYELLVSENQIRGKDTPEFELIHALSHEFAQGRYFEVFIEYAKAGQEDILGRITVTNRGPNLVPIHILPHMWFRNTWSWGYNPERPELRGVDNTTVRAYERHLGERWCHVEKTLEHGEFLGLLFTENETNFERLFEMPNNSPYVKDGIHEAVVNDLQERVNPACVGTKVGAHFKAELPPGESCIVRFRFTNETNCDPFSEHDAIFEKRIQEADTFYSTIYGQPGLSPEKVSIQRQALAGLLWSKQFYHYSVELWLKGDPVHATLSEQRKEGRNASWKHLYNLDVLSMPDKWEYPWYAAWDLAFHMIPVAMVDQEWAKRQLILLLREWFMHPNGQLPAYEWALGDVNPPVHAWAVWQVYQIDRDINDRADTVFLERAFHKLLLNFTWWVNRKDMDGNNIFQGGFLGLDNIGVFDRSKPLPTGGHLDQADGTAWMGMYSLNMLAIALELARTKPAYEDVATKFFEHFIYIADAFYEQERHGFSLWDDVDGFFYDALHTPDGNSLPLKVRSFVGLIPLLAVERLDRELLEKLPRFKRRMQWFLKYRPSLIRNIASLSEPGKAGDYQMAIMGREKLQRILERVFDPDEFLSDYGIRSLSRYHAAHPYEFWLGDQVHTVGYEPAESLSGLFGGNSNWRGPIWFPVNYLLIDALRRYHAHYGDNLTVEVPLGSGQRLDLGQAADEIGQRLIRIFMPDPERGNRRPVFGGVDYFNHDPYWQDYIPFYEYFHGDNGAGIGASHQTGWTALVARLIQECRD